jgi:AMP deaminase
MGGTLDLHMAQGMTSLTSYSSVDEWDKLAKFVINNKLYSHNVRWLIQIPRLYDVFKKSGTINNFEDVIRSE